MFSIGMDIGSVATKCALVKNGSLTASSIVKTGYDTERSSARALSDVLKSAQIKAQDVATVISTGYGRRTFKGADKTITEISAVAKGAYVLSGRKSCLVIDVGGQDTKIVDVSKDGQASDFLMNDKCAAGTGRFLEMMSSVFDTDLDGLSEIALKSDKPLAINSTCSVFAESEVVSLMSHAAKREDIAAGLFNAIAARINNMIKQMHSSNPIVFCGGGAKSAALWKSLKMMTGREISVPENPQFVAAYGAALLYN